MDELKKIAFSVVKKKFVFSVYILILIYIHTQKIC
jgi:hypothetical protein